MAARGFKETSHLRDTGMHEKFIKLSSDNSKWPYLYLYVHNSHFTDPLLKLSRTEY